jgi:hypothetical protein
VRAGAIRIVAVLILVSAVLGGGYLSLTTRAKERVTLDNQRLIAATVELQNDRQRVGEQDRVSRAARRQTESEAKDKADQIGKILADAAKVADEQATKAGIAGPPKPYDGPIPSSCREYSGNQAAGCALLLQAGYQLDQMPCLSSLWLKESGWNTAVKNSSTGAYGIPQARPGNKMASAGPNWQNSAETQIKWGLGYIKDRYGTPCSAWSYFRSTGWY